MQQRRKFTLVLALAFGAAGLGACSSSSSSDDAASDEPATGPCPALEQIVDAQDDYDPADDVGWAVGAGFPQWAPTPGIFVAADYPFSDDGGGEGGGGGAFNLRIQRSFITGNTAARGEAETPAARYEAAVNAFLAEVKTVQDLVGRSADLTAEDVLALDGLRFDVNYGAGDFYAAECEVRSDLVPLLGDVCGRIVEAVDARAFGYAADDSVGWATNYALGVAWTPVPGLSAGTAYAAGATNFGVAVEDFRAALSASEDEPDTIALADDLDARLRSIVNLCDDASPGATPDQGDGSQSDTPQSDTPMPSTTYPTTSTTYPTTTTTYPTTEPEPDCVDENGDFAPCP